MRQVATFKVPEEQDKANQFLKEHKPDTINFNTNLIVIFYDDGQYPIEHEIADINERILANRQAIFDKKVALHMMKAEQAAIPTNMARWRELDDAIRSMQEALDNHDMKHDFAVAERDRLLAELADGQGRA